ncbi:phosphate propanoyltransferase [Sporomusa malonica]|uniref:phosphate propanoyltransferase n=1 Tax=Sporomusa malonica TaxID=112901 RepID=UPI002481C4B5|nr:phosphate propanoyltransferase [Sporomusa malonica]
MSARHVHLSRIHLDILFGPGYQLHPYKYVYQPGQYAAEETVDLVTPKATFNNVRVLGPEREQTQVEISITDAIKLGLNVPVRDSGDIKGSPGITLIGPNGLVVIEKGVIAAWRHIHMNLVDASELSVKDRDFVRVQCGGEIRPIILEKVLVRVHDSFVLEMHIDTDEANAAMIANGDLLKIME